MGLKRFMENLMRKKKEKPVKDILVVMMQQHVESYPHSYFLRKGPRKIEFRRR